MFVCFTRNWLCRLNDDLVKQLFDQHQEKKGLLLWKRWVKEKKRFGDVRDLKHKKKWKLKLVKASQETLGDNSLFHYDGRHLNQLHGTLSILQGLS